MIRPNKEAATLPYALKMWPSVSGGHILHMYLIQTDA